MTDLSKVGFAKFHGEGSFSTWLSAACASCGVPENHFWREGMETLCDRESSFRPNAINLKDRNATGPEVADHHPQNCSRGIAQCIPSTFAQYHQDGTSWEIYDPIANISASINYAINFYGVNRDGSNLAEKVQQADKKRDRKGYIQLDEV